MTLTLRANENTPSCRVYPKCRDDNFRYVAQKSISQLQYGSISEVPHGRLNCRMRCRMVGGMACLRGGDH